MKRLLTIVFVSLLAIGLIACSNEQAEENNQSTDNVESDIESEISSEEVTEEEENKNENQSSHKDITEYEEATAIEDNVDINDMDVEVKTDNQNKRVLLFSSDDNVMYKTVYVKNKQRLKIINIHEDKGQIFNEIIKVDGTNEKEESSEKTNSPDNITDYEETTSIEDNIDITDMDVEVKTDNQNNRVLLFSDDDEVMYKTIYVKKKQRLKIINIHEDKGQIFNDTI